MQRSAVLSISTLLLLALAGGGAQAQGGAIPATAPTQSVSDLPSARPSQSLQRASVPVSGGAVQWDGAVLTVHASGEDLPGLLTQVARLTGLKVTGGVPDERVFGVYGPAPVQEVIAALFDGIYVNLLLVNDTATQPKELILTPRTGGATPPSPARSINAYDQQPARGDRPRRMGPPGGPPPGFPQSNVAPAPITAAPPATQGNNPAPTPDAGSQPQLQSGPRTPEQIFEELRKRQQQAQQGLAGQ